MYFRLAVNLLGIEREGAVSSHHFTVPLRPAYRIEPIHNGADHPYDKENMEKEFLLILIGFSL